MLLKVLLEVSHVFPFTHPINHWQYLTFSFIQHILVPSQPRDLTFDMLCDESALLSWKRPFYTGGELRKYVILYGTESDRKTKELKSGLRNENVTMVIDGLNSKKKYDVQVNIIKRNQSSLGQKKQGDMRY